jgi:hypothetical protein
MKRQPPIDWAFLRATHHGDPLAEELAQEVIEKMTSGEDGAVELRDAFFDEEIGGPFVTTTAGQEFADDIDESNPIRSRREPFPRT